MSAVAHFLTFPTQISLETRNTGHLLIAVSGTIVLVLRAGVEISGTQFGPFSLENLDDTFLVFLLKLLTAFLLFRFLVLLWQDVLDSRVTSEQDRLDSPGRRGSTYEQADYFVRRQAVRMKQSQAIKVAAFRFFVLDFSVPVTLAVAAFAS